MAASSGALPVVFFFSTLYWHEAAKAQVTSGCPFIHGKHSTL
jgi:hypothetical protein